MPLTPDKVRALDGKKAEIIGAVGVPVRFGTFRVKVAQTASLYPDVEVDMADTGKPAKLWVPHLCLPAVLATEDKGSYVFWHVPEGSTRPPI